MPVPKKPHIPDAQSRATVESLSGYGVPQQDIARILRISLPTLHKHYRDDLDLGMAKANASVGQTLHQLAVRGNVAAAIFWAKTRMGWSEKVRVDISLTRDPRDLSDAELAAIARGSSLPAVDSEASEVEPPDVGERIH